MQDMVTWTKEQVEQVLTEKEWLSESRNIPNGTHYVLIDGTPIDWYTTGRVVVRGKVTEIQNEASGIFSADPLPKASVVNVSLDHAQPTPSRVFIVYGHDATAREQLELILRRLRLEPIVLQNLPTAGDTLIEKLETLTAADFACVLLTPDDEGYPRGTPDQKQFRARQNVVLELGMVLAKLGRRRVAILVKGSNIERPSDIDGLIYLPFHDRVDDTKNQIAANLQEAGFEIQVKDLL